jgi:hypothetical protein
MNCPTLSAEVPDPCPRRHATRGCEDCRVSLDERAAILQYGQAFSGCSDQAVVPRQSERAMCPTREDAERLARSQALEAMPGQRNLIPG